MLKFAVVLMVEPAIIIIPISDDEHNSDENLYVDVGTTLRLLPIFLSSKIFRFCSRICLR